MESKKYQGEVVVKSLRGGFSWGLFGTVGRLTLRCEAVGEDGPSGAQFTTAAEAQDFAAGHGLTVVERFSPEPAPAEPEPTPGVAERMGRDVVIVRLRHRAWAVRSAALVTIPGWCKGSAFFYVAGFGWNRTDCPAHARAFVYSGDAIQWAESLGLNVLRVLPHREPAPNPPALAAYRCKDGTLAPRLTPAQAERLALLLGADGVES